MPAPIPSSALLAALLLALPGVLLSRATPEGVVVTREAGAMGTLLRIRVEADDRAVARAAAEAALAEVERWDRLLSTWIEDTPLSRLNRAEPGAAVRPPAEIGALLAEADAWSRRTGGAFQPRVGALVDAWDLRGEGRAPTEHELERALRAASPASIELDPEGGTLVRRDPAAWIDAGGFGKGAALRAAAGAVREAGARSATLDLGGQIVVVGGPSEGPPIEVAHPSRRGEGVARLLLSDASVATSGTSERWIEVDGARFGHLLDPRSGRPAPAWGSVTVVAGDPLVADVLATALYVMGPERGSRWIEGAPDVGALFLVERDGEVLPSWNTAMERWLTGHPARIGAGPG